ncbi:SDR family oxidoreductase [Iodobacter sp. LRB]|uniref:SDR family oxidoreductase n=1 Tax=unclassified Iodobacter TaxID=235634 RepID=UPI000C0DA83E|nr:SDR family oxidoreductase [Iodobacter sp. BJB302]PHU99875.1 short-chain dehydrogenase [Iodobacter sp. BJB302]
MLRLKNKVALITGGTTGIGFSTAQAFIAAGAKVAITGQNPERLKAAVDALGAGTIGIQADQSNIGDLDVLANQIAENFGKLDVLFVNAGIVKTAALTEITPEHVNEHLSVNFTGVLFTIQRLLPLLNNPSSIILTSTAFTEMGMPGMSVYSASKAATRSLARTLSAELLPRGIRVNCVSPGPVETPIFGKLGLAPEILQAMAGQIVGKVPMARLGKPEEIARAVLFLASEDSSYVTGQDFVIDGGMAAL